MRTVADGHVPPQRRGETPYERMRTRQEGEQRFAWHLRNIRRRKSARRRARG